MPVYFRAWRTTLPAVTLLLFALLLCLSLALSLPQQHVPDTHAKNLSALSTFYTPESSNWHELFLALISYYRFEMYQNLGPYGTLLNNTAEQAKVLQQIPEMHLIYNKEKSKNVTLPFYNADHQPLWINAHNFLITSSDIADNIVYQKAFTEATDSDYNSILLSPPFFNPSSILFNEDVRVLSVQSNIDLLAIKAGINALQKNQDHIDFHAGGTEDMLPSTSVMVKEQADVYEHIMSLFPTLPYIRLEVENVHFKQTYKKNSNYDNNINTNPYSQQQSHPGLQYLTNFKNWLDNYPNLALNAEFVFLKLSEYARYWKNPSSTIIFIEPDRVLHHPNGRYERASQSGTRALILLVVIFAIIIGSQLFFQWWSQHPTYQTSYNLFIVLTLWLVPFVVALIDHFKRFIIIWWCYTIITALVISLLFIDLNPMLNAFFHFLDSLGDNIQQQTQQLSSSSSTLDSDIVGDVRRNNNQGDYYYIIPQRYIFATIYKYFLLTHKVIMLLLGISLIIFFADIFGVFQAMGLEPHMVGEIYHGHSATPDEVLTFLFIALYGFFYAIYFGVLNRDIATIIIPQLTLLSSHYKLTKSINKINPDGKNDDENNNNNDAIPKKEKQKESSSANPQWNMIGSILSDSNNPTDGQNSDDEEQKFGFDDYDGDAENTSLIKNHKHNVDSTNTVVNNKSLPISTNLVNNANSCGICHELLRSQKDSDSPVADTIKQDLPTIAEIRSRLRHNTGGGRVSGESGPKKTVISRIMSSLATGGTLVFFWAIELLDKITGGSGEVKIDNVTIVEGMYTIQEHNSLAPVRRDDDNDSNIYGGFDDGDDETTLGGSAFASTTRGESTLQTNNDVVFQLPCGCFSHDLCLRGYMLLGKYNVCPSCKEISPVGEIFTTPFNSVYDNYKNFLDAAKYCIAVNPMLLFIINIILNFFW